MRTILLSLLAVFAVSASAQDTKAEQIRKVFNAHKDSVSTLTWTNTTSARGQDMESERSTTVVMLPGGLGMVTASATKSKAGGLASMFGGGSSKDSGWKYDFSGGISCTSVHEDKDTNLRFFDAPILRDGVDFPEKVSVPALAEEVLIISSHGKLLKNAKFFRLARINCTIEDGKMYGLDGSIGDCLGGLVVSLDGKILGIVGQVKDEESAGGGGIGGMLGGLDDPSKAMGNRVLLTPAVFSAAIKAAKSGKKPVASEASSGGGSIVFKSTVASAVKRDARKDVFVLIGVPEDQTAPEDGEIVSLLDGDGKSVGTFKVTRRYKDGEGRVEQIGGSVKNATGDIAKGMAAVTYAKSATHAELKLTLESGDELAKVYGANVGLKVVAAPAEGSIEAKAGLKMGDLIVKFGATRVTAETKTEAFTKWLSEAKAAKITVARAGSTELTDITLK